MADDQTAENFDDLIADTSLEDSLSAIDGGAGDDGSGGGMGASDNGSGMRDDDSGFPEESDRNLGLILDVPLQITVELGRTRLVVSELLNLGQGSVVELSKLAGETMEVLVNNKLVAKGEAVVVNEKFGVRLTEIISPMERVEQLK